MPTEPPHIKKEMHVCVFCGYPGAVHRGGYRKPNGTIGEEWFCCEDHFDKWLLWQSMITPVRQQMHLSKFEGVKA